MRGGERQAAGSERSVGGPSRVLRCVQRAVHGAACLSGAGRALTAERCLCGLVGRVSLSARPRALRVACGQCGAACW